MVEENHFMVERTKAPCGWRDDQYIIVHPCTRPSYQAKWQASFFDAEGASGHVIGL